MDFWGCAYWGNSCQSFVLLIGDDMYELGIKSIWNLGQGYMDRDFGEREGLSLINKFIILPAFIFRF